MCNASDKKSRILGNHQSLGKKNSDNGNAICPIYSILPEKKMEKLLQILYVYLATYMATSKNTLSLLHTTLLEVIYAKNPFLFWLHT